MTITSILLSTLLSNFGTFASAAPELCDIPYLAADGSVVNDATGRHLARYCEWADADAPTLDSDVCCELDASGASCELPDARGRCQLGERYSCAFGLAMSTGGVSCYQPFPSACAAGYCVDAPALPPDDEAMMVLCCSLGGICQEVTGLNAEDCDGDFVGCLWGIENIDGTVECFD